MMAVMRVLLTVFAVVFALVSFDVRAQVVDSGYSLKKKAIVLSARADSYAAFCEKESAMSDGYLARFREDKDVSEEQVTELASLLQTEKTQTMALLKSEGRGCKDLEFMLKKLEIMRELKDVSYLLNGVAEEDIPKDNIPNLDDLMLPDTDL